MKRVLTERERLERIRDIIEGVDMRCCAADGPVTTTREEITASELIEIYKLTAPVKPKKKGA